MRTDTKSLDEFLARSADVLDDWEGSSDAMLSSSELGTGGVMLADGGNGGGDVGDLPVLSDDLAEWGRRVRRRFAPVFNVPSREEDARPVIVPRATNSVVDKPRLSADDVAEVAGVVPDNREVGGKHDVVRQVFEAALDAGWSPPERAS